MALIIGPIRFRSTRTGNREIVITRIFDAPRGFTTKASSMDLKVGGAWHFVMRHDRYGEFKNRAVYREILRPERLRYTHDSGVDGDPAAFEVTVTFEETSVKTKVTMQSVFPSAAELKRVKGFGAVEGGNQPSSGWQSGLPRASEHVPHHRP